MLLADEVVWVDDSDAPEAEWYNWGLFGTRGLPPISGRAPVLALPKEIGWWLTGTERVRGDPCTAPLCWACRRFHSAANLARSWAISSSNCLLCSAKFLSPSFKRASKAASSCLAWPTDIASDNCESAIPPCLFCFGESEGLDGSTTRIHSPFRLNKVTRQR